MVQVEEQPSPVNFVTVVALVGCKDSVSAELGSYGWGVDDMSGLLRV